MWGLLEIQVAALPQELPLHVFGAMLPASCQYDAAGIYLKKGFRPRVSIKSVPAIVAFLHLLAQWSGIPALRDVPPANSQT